MKDPRPSPIGGGIYVSKMPAAALKRSPIGLPRNMGATRADVVLWLLQLRGFSSLSYLRARRGACLG